MPRIWHYCSSSITDRFILQHTRREEKEKSQGIYLFSLPTERTARNMIAQYPTKGKKNVLIDDITLIFIQNTIYF